MLLLENIEIKFKLVSYLTFASLVANDSQLCSNISPCGSTILTPLSGSGLWDAVIITPTVALKKTNNKLLIFEHNLIVRLM